MDLFLTQLEALGTYIIIIIITIIIIYIYGAAIMTKAIVRVHPVHLMNAEERQVATNTQTKPTDSDCESADK